MDIAGDDIGDKLHRINVGFGLKGALADLTSNEQAHHQRDHPAFAHLAVVILVISELRVLAHVDRNPCWLGLSCEGFKGKLVGLTTEQLEWPGQIPRVAAAMHLSAALANAGLVLLREEPHACGTAAGSGDFIRAVYRAEPVQSPPPIPDLPFN